MTAFDRTKHHIGLGETDADLLGLIIEGSYRKNLQTVRVPTQFGGTTDYGNLAPELARWTQDDFSGGSFGYHWGADNKMFSYCTSMLPVLDAKTLRTVPPIILDTAKADNSVILYSFARGSHVLFVRPTEVQRYNTVTKVWDSWPIPGSGLAPASCAAYDRAEEYLYVGVGAKIQILDLATFASPVGGLKTEYSLPAGVASLTSLFAGKSYLGAVTDRDRLYTISLPTDRTLSATFTDIVRVPGSVRQAITFNGVSYLLLADGLNNTAIVSFDGANLLPITDFPYNFEGKCVIAYGGRVYVGGTGRDLSGNADYPEFYEVTGSTLRLVRTFTPESRDGGEATPFASATAVTAMGVHEGLLFLGFDSYGLLAYDLSTDSLYGGPEYQPAVGNPVVRAIVTANESLNLFVTSSTLASSGLYRVSALGDSVAPYNGRLVTSDFAPEPALDKRWSELHVVTRYGGVELEYSTDGGSTYSNVTGAPATDGSYIHTIFNLASVPVSKRVRFRLSFQRTSTSTSYTELVALTLGFLFLTPGKRLWTFSVNGASRVQRVSGDTEVQQPATISALLFTWASEKVPLYYHDLDGSVCRVNITSYSDFKPVVGPTIDDDGNREGFYALTLTEV